MIEMVSLTTKEEVELMVDRSVLRAQVRAHLEPAARALMQVWYLKTMSQRFEVPTPRDLPQYRWSGKAHRMLLIGNGPSHGWGVLTHGYSLTGLLGAELRSASGKPVNVDYVGDELMNVQTALDWIADIDIAAYDVIAVLVGWNDAVRLTPEAIWQEHITEFFDELRARKRADAGIVAVGIEEMSHATGYVGLVGTLGQRHADKLNVTLAAEMSGSREVFLPLTPRQIDSTRPIGSPTTYQPWAAAIAQVATPLLPHGEPKSELPTDAQEFRWIGAARALGRDGSNTPARFAELEQEARDTFGMQVAQITILDSDRQWFPNHAGPAPSSAPRHLTYCHVAAQQREMLIVPNANKDERFKGNPYLEQSHMPFYAGKALVDRKGEVIGSFCVLDSVPRPAWWTLNRKKFEHFAQQAQDELWRIEDEALASKPQRKQLIGAE